VPATAFVLSIPFYAVGMLSTSLVLAFFVFLVPTALGLVWLGPVITSIQQLVPPAMRATASAVFLFINNLIGIGFGIFFFGKMSDILGPRFGAESLRYSILIGLVFYVLAALLFFLASRRLERDWHR
jgi:MFS family permease